MHLLQLLDALFLPFTDIEARSSSITNQRSGTNLRSNRPMATAARQHVPAIHLSDALLTSCHCLVTRAIRAQNAFGRSVTGLLPKPMLNAVTRSQVRHEKIAICSRRRSVRDMRHVEVVYHQDCKVSATGGSTSSEYHRGGVGVWTLSAYSDMHVQQCSVRSSKGDGDTSTCCSGSQGGGSCSVYTYILETSQ